MPDGMDLSKARDNVRNLKSQRVDFIKIWMTDPKFPPDRSVDSYLSLVIGPCFLQRTKDK